MHSEKTAIISSRYLWFLTLSYTMVLAFANWFDPRLIEIAGLNTDAGTLIFPLTFLLSDLITEVYGYKFARRAIWAGFLFNMLFLAYGQLIVHLPSPSYAVNNDAFDVLLAANGRIIIASIFSYFCAEPLNSYTMAKLKIKTKGRYMSLRFILSTVIASGLDSFVFGTIAFFGTMNNANLLALILTMWFIKVCIEILGLPGSLTLAKKMKAIEHTDIYDIGTNFSLFKLDVDYKDTVNKYRI